MPSRSKITRLPPDIRLELEKRLIAGGFSDYSGLTTWLNEELAKAGAEELISRTAVARFGQGFEDRCQKIKIATEQARAITEAVGDDAGMMGNALINLVQEKAFDVLVKMTDLDPESIDFNKLTVAVAKLNNAAVNQKKWQSEVRRRATEAADDVVRTVRKEGLSEKKAEEIGKRILGIV